MDTFIVRVYRSRLDVSSDGDRLRGLVDEVSTGLQATFDDSHELLAILRCSQELPATGGANEPGQA